MDYITDLLNVGTTYEDGAKLDKYSPSEIIELFPIGKEERLKEFHETNNKCHEELIEKTKHGDLSELTQVSSDEMEALYSFAHDFYKNGNFEKALNVFRMLTLMEIRDYRFVYGLACTLKEMELYILAVRFFNLATIIEPTNPVPSYQAADCFNILSDEFSNLRFLEIAIDLAGDQHKYEAIKTRALLEYNQIILKNIHIVESY